MAFELSGLRMVLYGILYEPKGSYPDVGDGGPSLLHHLGLYREAHKALEVCESLTKLTAQSEIEDREEKRSIHGFPDNFDELYDKYYRFNFDCTYRVVGVEVH